VKIFPSENLGYFDTVQAFFLELTGRGMTLSGRDVELLLRWRDQGATAATICQGIDCAVSAMSERPRDIWACRHQIEPLVARARRSATGGGARDAEPRSASTYGDAVLAEAIAVIEACGQGCEREAFKSVYREAWRRLREIRESESDDALADLAGIETWLTDAIFEALDSSEQKRIDSQIRSAHAELLRSMSSQARERHLAAHRRRLLAEDYDVPNLL